MIEQSVYRCMRVVNASRENYRSTIIELDGYLNAKPGQFLMVWIPGLGEKPYSIMQAAPLTLLVVEVGKFSQHLAKFREGRRVWIRGPLGKGFAMPKKECILVGGGYGAAPIYFLASELSAMQIRPVIFLGFRSCDDFVLIQQFRQKELPVVISTEDGSTGEKGFITQAVEREIEIKQPLEILACGPAAMLNALENVAHSHNISCQLSREAHMRCGIGLCGSCELESNGVKTGWLTCLDGPVQQIK